ncbi:MAG: family N-acetyltransferase [Bacillales bacterium]|jgi:ribosomal protein S18 acetylase RimI-like enzyme|nr:family N-acetyltransferase [Bacillales bacterium]
MIKIIDTKTFINAMSILKTQAPAYRVEGALIGFYGIPAMKETVESILNSKDTYVGFYNDNQLLGFIAFNECNGTVDIVKLAIHPSHFRKGVAKQLLNYLFESLQDAILFKVSTGTKNTPAIELYKTFGFQEIGQKEVASAVYITQFEKQINRG